MHMSTLDNDSMITLMISGSITVSIGCQCRPWLPEVLNFCVQIEILIIHK